MKRRSDCFTHIKSLGSNESVIHSYKNNILKVTFTDWRLKNVVIYSEFKYLDPFTFCMLNTFVNERFQFLVFNKSA